MDPTIILRNRNLDFMKTTNSNFWSYFPAILLSIFGFIFSILVFFPGWVTPDSIWQYTDGIQNQFRNWHPPLMAWWWGKLSLIYSGAGLFLIQNLLFYWLAWGLISIAATRKYENKIFQLVPVFAFWPGLFFPLGEIWKDVVFAVSIFLAWSILYFQSTFTKKYKLSIALLLFVLAGFAIGVKPNGILVLPLLFAYAFYVLEIKFSTKILSLVAILVSVMLSFFLSTIPLIGNRIEENYTIQYNYVYDLVAISAYEDKNYLPDYLMSKLPQDEINLDDYYMVESNDKFYFLSGFDPGTKDAAEFNILQKTWLDTVLSHPKQYLYHRYLHFLSLLRLEGGNALVAYAGATPNDVGLDFKPNSFSVLIEKIATDNPWLFYSWIYSVAGILAAIFLFFKTRQDIFFILSTVSSSLLFILPHFFVGPSNDFRYLFYSNLVFVLLVSLGSLRLVQLIVERISGRISNTLLKE